jgi:hypothetical protein
LSRKTQEKVKKVKKYRNRTNCECCCFYAFSSAESGDAAGVGYGECRKRSPGIADANQNPSWPLVLADQWCGDWEFAAGPREWFDDEERFADPKERQVEESEVGG